MDFWTAVQTCFRKFATFQGRARRSEFWYFWLFIILGSIVSAILDAAFGTDIENSTGVVGGVFTLATLIPMIAVTARRLHDTNRSGWWQFAAFVPALILGFVGGWLVGTGTEAAAGAAIALLVVMGLAVLAISILVLIWLVSAGTRGANRFGEDPMGPPVLVQPYRAPPPGPGAGPGQPWR